MMRAQALLCALGFCALVIVAGSSSAANVLSTWQGGVGNWENPAKWSSNPFYPNNGNGGFLFDVTVPQDPTTLITFNDNVVVENLSLFSGGLKAGNPGLTFKVNNLVQLKSSTQNLTHLVTQDLEILPTPLTDYALTEEVFDIQRSARWLGGTLLGQNAIFNIAPAAIFDIQSDAKWDWGINSTTDAINNSGLLVKSTTSGMAWLRVPLINTGTVEVRQGTLQIEKGNSSCTIRVLSGARFLFNHVYNISGAYDGEQLETAQQGFVTFDPGATFKNVKSLLVQNGKLFLNTGSPQEFQNLTISGISTLNRGLFGGSDALTFTGESFIHGARFQGGGSTTFNGPTIVDSGSLDVQGYTIVIGETLTQRTLIDGNSGGTIQVLPTGIVTIENDNHIRGAVVNAGSLRKVSGTGVSEISALTNSGNVEIQSGGIRLRGSAGSLAGTFSGATGTSLEINGGYSLKPGVTFGSLPVSVTGRANIETGASVQWTTLALSGIVDVKAGASLTLPAPLIMSGTLGGLGTINATVTSSGGTVDPGVIGSIAANPILTLNGNYTQSPAGRLRIDVNSPTSAIIGDILDVHGTADLAGTITLFELFSRQLRAGDHFDILWADQIIDHGYSASFPMGLRSGVTFITSIEQRGDRQALRVDMVAVPEPAALLLVGLCVLGAARRLRRK